MARAASILADLLPISALCALVAGATPLIGPALGSVYRHQPPSVSFQTLGVCIALILLGVGYFWLQSKGPDNRLKQLLLRPTRTAIAAVFAVAALVPAVGAFVFSDPTPKLLTLVPFSLLATYGLTWFFLIIIEDIAADSVPAWIENRSESLWLKKTEARLKQSFRNGCFIFSGAFGLTSLLLWGVGRFDPSAMSSLLVFEMLGCAAGLCLFAGWVTGSFLQPD